MGDVDKASECGLILECRVVSKGEMPIGGLPDDIVSRFYLSDVGSESCGNNRDPHVVYHTKVMDTYAQMMHPRSHT